MSDERELPKRVWIDLRYALPSADREVGTWMSSPATEGDVPYLRADKPSSYVVRRGDQHGARGGAPTLEQAREMAARYPGDTVHPVYIGPAIEPEEESDASS